MLRRISERFQGLKMRENSSLVGKLFAGIGVAFAGTFIAKKIFGRKKEEKKRTKTNPILAQIGGKTPEAVVDMFLRQEQTRMSMHTVMPLPAEYINGLAGLSDVDKSELFKRAMFAKDNFRYHEARDLLGRLYAMGLGGSERCAVSILIGNCFYNTGMFDAALQKYSEALEEAKAAGDMEAEAAALGNSAIACLHRYSFDKARRFCEEALKLYKTLDRVGEQADQLSNLALIYRKSGEVDQAIKAQKEALAIYRHSKEPLKEAAALGNLGLAYQQKGDANKALECFRQSLDIYVRERNRKGEAEQLCNMGGAYQQKGDLEAAMRHEEEALAIHREIGNVDGEANTLGNIGLLYQQTGEYDKALGYFGDALRLHRQIGNAFGEATGLVNIGIIYRRTGDLKRAVECQRKALKMFTAMGAKAQVEIVRQNIKRIQDMMIIRKVDYDGKPEE